MQRPQDFCLLISHMTQVHLMKTFLCVKASEAFFVSPLVSGNYTFTKVSKLHIKWDSNINPCFYTWNMQQR